MSYLTSLNSVGYHFSTNGSGPYNDKYSDVFFEYSNGVAYKDVWDDSDVQGMGFISSFDNIRGTPNRGWAPTKDVRLIVGHTYVVWTWEDHYPKFLVTSLSFQRAVFDWAFQLYGGNPLPKHSTRGRGNRGSLTRISASQHKS